MTDQTAPARSKTGLYVVITAVVVAILTAVAMWFLLGGGNDPKASGFDPFPNLNTGLPDGQYTLATSAQQDWNDTCMYVGTVTGAQGGSPTTAHMVLVGRDAQACPKLTTLPTVAFTVDGGIATINAVK